MKLDTLKRANYLLNEIKLKETLVDDLKTDLFFLDKYEFDFMNFSTNEIQHSYPIQRRLVHFKIETESIKKSIRNQLYIEENRLKRYKLEFENI